MGRTSFPRRRDLHCEAEAANNAMRAEGTHAETRVWGSNVAPDLVSGPGLDSTCRTHWRFTYSYGELASGSSINGNRLSGTNSGGNASMTYDAQDRMSAYGAASYTYGPSGDLRTKAAGGQTTTYSYDALGSLMGAWLPDGRVIEYVVDGLNRRVGKKVNGALVEGFLYDGQFRPVAWLDATGAVKATFVYGLHVNVPEYMTTSAGTYRFIHDHLGSPRLVVDTTSGAVVQRMDYDSFGQVLADTNPGFQPFGFAGGLWDRDTGLVRFGARDYDPSVGRWTNKDARLFDAGDTNLYAYVANDPVNFIDPEGEEAITVAAGAEAALGAAVGETLAFLGTGVAIGGAFAGGWAIGTAINPYVTDYIQDALDYIFKAEEHTKNARPSTQEKHEKGQKRKEMVVALLARRRRERRVEDAHELTEVALRGAATAVELQQVGGGHLVLGPTRDEPEVVQE